MQFVCSWFFFFSSRRRHTRCSRDWSSDVCSSDLNRVIADLHRVDYAAAGLGEFGRPGNYMARQIARWSRQYRASETETIPAMDRLIDWLPKHLPPEGPPAIVHGDYRMDNLIFHKTEPRVVGVLDWEL